MRRIDERLAYLLVLALALCCLSGFYVAAAEAPLHVPFDPNEGWNAYFQSAAWTGAPLYPGPHDFMINNYPPLSFFAVGALGAALSDNIFAGRIVSLAAFATAFGLVVACARRMGARPLAAAFGACFFAATVLAFSDYVGMNDPQLLAHAMQLLALYIVLREPRSAFSISAAAVVFGVSLFVKHNLIALPLSILLWLALYERRLSLQMAIVGISVGLVGLGVFRLAFRSDLLSHFLSARQYSFANIMLGVQAAVQWSSVPLFGTVVLLALRRDDRAYFCGIYACAGSLLGVLAIGGDGVDVNAFFDAAIAFSLAAALLVDQLMERQSPALALTAVLYLAPLAFGVWTKADASWMTSDFWNHPGQDSVGTAQEDIAFLKAHRGPAICETLPLCYWAGKQASVDVFNLGQAYATGARSDRALIAQLDRRHYAVLEFEALAPFQLGNDVLAAVRRNYRVARSSDDGLFFTPLR